MGIVDDLEDMFADEVTLEAPTGLDGYGVPTGYAAPVTVKAHVMGHTRRTRDQTGQERVSTVQVILAGAPGASVNHRYTLPARYTLAQPKALSVDHYTDEDGAHHEQVNFA